MRAPRSTSTGSTHRRCRALPAALAAICAGLAVVPATAAADNVVADDQIVQGSQCVGIDCVNNEVFGFSTQVLKENNTRLLFNDTSTSAGFATENWGLIANSNQAGGPSFFGLADLGSDGTETSAPGEYPFKVAAGAGDNALYVGGTGDVGLGTADPQKELQITDSDSPTMRLEQTNSGGFSPQTWDVGGNEANFFVRDQTNGSKLPFRIRPGAPNSSVDIASNGDVGMGTQSPTSALDIQRGNGSAQVKVTESDGTTQLRSLIALANNGPSNIAYTNADGGTHPTWIAGTNGGDDFTVDTEGSSTPPLTVGPTGDVSSGGALLQNADPAQQTNVQNVDPAQVLDQIDAIPLKTWTYSGNSAGGSHIGPAADAFHTATGLGSTDPELAPGDTAGVALAGVQALKQQFDALAANPGDPTAVEGQAEQNKRFRSQIDRLRKQKNKLRARVRKLEQAVFHHKG